MLFFTDIYEIVGIYCMDEDTTNIRSWYHVEIEIMATYTDEGTSVDGQNIFHQLFLTFQTCIKDF